MVNIPSQVDTFQQKLAPVLARWGAYCASHQIKVLLLDCLVLSTLVCMVWPFDILPSLSLDTTPRDASSRPAQLFRSHQLESTSSKQCWRAWPRAKELHLIQLSVDSSRALEHRLLGSHNLDSLQQSISKHFAVTSDWNCLTRPEHHDACLIMSPSEDLQYSQASNSTDDPTSLSSPHPGYTLSSLASDTREWQTPMTLSFLLQPPNNLSRTPKYDARHVQRKLQQATAGFGDFSLSPAESSSMSPSKLVLKVRRNLVDICCS